MKKIIFLISLILVLSSLCNIHSQDTKTSATPIAKEIKPHKALYWEKLEEDLVMCKLCPRRCILRLGQRGFCGVRENINGELFSLCYGLPCAVHIDPIEKKPFFHFLPKSRSFSLATVGCNLRCKFCQNWSISMAKPEDVVNFSLSPEDLVRMAKERNCESIAYTYTEPAIFYEYMLDTAKLAKKEGIKNVMHSAGYINPEPLREICKYLDGINIDLKGFTEDFYSELTYGSLSSVLQTLKIIKEEGVHLEITNLVIPTKNDSPQEIKQMCLWIKENLGQDTVLHFSRFWPMYKLTNLAPTPVTTLEEAKRIAEEVGLKYVYIGNVPGHRGENTYCPKCKRLLIRRIGFSVLENNIEKGRCKFCGEEIPGVWE
jgi:pyruvate formate lyase activating enzyme